MSCGLCTRPLEGSIVQHPGHAFHEPCLSEWARKFKICPVGCRKDVSSVLSFKERIYRAFSEKVYSPCSDFLMKRTATGILAVGIPLLAINAAAIATGVLTEEIEAAAAKVITAGAVLVTADIAVRKNIGKKIAAIAATVSAAGAIGIGIGMAGKGDLPVGVITEIVTRVATRYLPIATISGSVSLLALLFKNEYVYKLIALAEGAPGGYAGEKAILAGIAAVGTGMAASVVTRDPIMCAPLAVSIITAGTLAGRLQFLEMAVAAAASRRVYFATGAVTAGIVGLSTLINGGGWYWAGISGALSACFTAAEAHRVRREIPV